MNEPSSEIVRATGVIKTLLHAKMYGFISSQGKEYFFHKTGLRGVVFPALNVGDIVTFIGTEGKKPGTLRAVDVTRE